MTLDPRDNLLKIAAHYNMEGYKDQNISLPSNIGCAGHALTNDSEAFYDPRTMNGMGVDPDKVWKELKSIISMPIHDSDRNRLGVLNIDSDNKMDKTKFTDEHFKYTMGLAADAFGRLLEKKCNV